MKRYVRHAGLFLLGVAVLSLAACGPAVLEQSANSTVTATIEPTATTASPPTVTVTVTLQSSAPATTHSTLLTVSSASSSGVSHTASTSGSRVATATSSSGQVSVDVYFTSGSRLVSEPHLVPAATPARGSLDALLTGPTVAGHFSQIPNGTRLLNVNLAAGTATVNFSEQIQNIQGSPAIPLFLGQVVNTLTQFPDVQRVMLETNGQPLRSLGGEGAAVPEPLDRAAVQRMLSGG